MDPGQNTIHQTLKRFFESKISTLVVNILAWAVFLLVPLFLIRFPQHSTGELIFIVSVLVIVFYVNSLFLFNKFLIKGAIAKYLIGVALLLGLMYVLISFALNRFESQKIVTRAYTIENQSIADAILKTVNENKSINREKLLDEIQKIKEKRRLTHPQRLLFVMFFMIALSTATKITQAWMKNEKLQKESDREKLNAELNFLKSQVNPHFLFNTLNSIYSLAYKRSEQAHHAIAKLSNILRYMLYETDNSTVPLESEYQYLQDYIHLQKLRLYDNTEISFETSGDIAQVQIAPMLLVPFVENAFKHGVDNSSECFIHIRLEVNQSDLFFKIENSIPKSLSTPITGSSGIGLQNVKRRLKLLYPDNHLLLIDKTNETYCIKLNIRLTGYELHNS